jgi:hypothetical protein
LIFWSLFSFWIDHYHPTEFDYPFWSPAEPPSLAHLPPPDPILDLLDGSSDYLINATLAESIEAAEKFRFTPPDSPLGLWTVVSSPSLSLLFSVLTAN